MTFLHNAGKFDSQVPTIAVFCLHLYCVGVFLVCLLLFFLRKIYVSAAQFPPHPSFPRKQQCTCVVSSFFEDLSIFLEAQLCIHVFCNRFSSLGVFTSFSMGQCMYS